MELAKSTLTRTKVSGADDETKKTGAFWLKSHQLLFLFFNCCLTTFLILFLNHQSIIRVKDKCPGIRILFQRVKFCTPTFVDKELRVDLCSFSNIYSLLCYCFYQWKKMTTKVLTHFNHLKNSSPNICTFYSTLSYSTHLKLSSERLSVSKDY